MKSKFLTLLCSFLVLFSVNAHAFTLNDATSFDPVPVQVQAASIGVPVGTVIVWTREEIPDGWLECNGQPVPAEYPDLLALMPNVPNYQGMFLRGAGSQTIEHGKYGFVTHGTNLGQIQGDTIRNIEGTVKVMYGAQAADGVFEKTYHSSVGFVGGSGIWIADYIPKINASNTVPTSEENRPVNIGVKYLIKAE